MLHEDFAPLSMVGRLLTSGKTAVLNERLLNNAKVSALFADANFGRDLGTFEFFAQLSEKTSFDEVEEIFHRSVQELADGTIGDDQLTIAKNNLLKEVYGAATTPDSLGQKLGDGFINTNDLAFQIHAVDRIANVTKEGICRVTKKYILDGKSTCVKLLHH
jgi:predicted Zn-dependent peptidase